MEKSHPSRVRGLKQKLYQRRACCRIVAPLAGAWIETCLSLSNLHLLVVAPLAGAWIETGVLLSPRQSPQRSHPSRVRGLKH